VDGLVTLREFFRSKTARSFAPFSLTTTEGIHDSRPHRLALELIVKRQDARREAVLPWRPDSHVDRSLRPQMMTVFTAGCPTTVVRNE
jgi:hypothetical protein